MSRRKFELIADFFPSSNLDFCFVQETMISNESKIASLSASWRGPSFWAPAVGRRGGVAILCSQDFSDQVSVWQKDSNGRIVSLLVQCDSVKLNLVNVYAPTVPVKERFFFRECHLFSFRILILSLVVILIVLIPLLIKWAEQFLWIQT